MTRFIVGGLAVAAMTGIALMQPAEARCFWNGVNTVCTHPHSHGYYVLHHYARPTKLVLFAHRRHANRGREHEIGQGSSTPAGAAGPHAPPAVQKTQASDAQQPPRQDDTNKNEQH